MTFYEEDRIAKRIVIDDHITINAPCQHPYGSQLDDSLHWRCRMAARLDPRHLVSSSTPRQATGMCAPIDLK
jgi:hypothetical protein